MFVLTHSERPPNEMAGGTTFEFLAAAPVDVLKRAQDAAGGKDVRIGGGATVVRDFLKAGLIDQRPVAINPHAAGQGHPDLGGLAGT
ncbi:MAG: dihydrofolate reductase family protein [Specibacter sp.]